MAGNDFIQGRDGKMQGRRPRKNKPPRPADERLKDTAQYRLEQLNSNPVHQRLFEEMWERYRQHVPTDELRGGLVANGKSLQNHPEEQDAQRALLDQAMAVLATVKDKTARERAAFWSNPLARGFDGNGSLDVRIILLEEIATTPAGRKLLEAEKAQFEKEGDRISAGRLNAALTRGKTIAHERTEHYRLEDQKKRNAEKAVGDKGMRTKQANCPDPRNSLKFLYRDTLAKQWDPDNVDFEGKPLKAYEVKPLSNIPGDWICPTCGHHFTMEMKRRVTLHIDGKEACSQCRGRTNFKRSRDAVEGLVDIAGKDPEALAAVDYHFLQSMMADAGLAGRGEDLDEANNPIVRLIARGEVTTSELLAMHGPSQLQDLLDEAEKAGDGIAEFETDERTAFSTPHADENPQARYPSGSLVRSAALAAALPENQRDAYLDSLNDKIWVNVFDADVDAAADPAGVLAEVRAAADGSGNPWVSGLAARFAKEYEETAAYTPPVGYQGEFEPTMFQRRFALQVAETMKRGTPGAPDGGNNGLAAYMNWSGVGAGKTLGSIIAVREVGAENTLLLCPANLRDQWSKELRSAYPDTEVIVARDQDHLKEIARQNSSGGRRVIIVNYDKLSGRKAGEMRDDIAETLRPLTKTVDAIVLDEVHQVKQRYEGKASQRKGALTEFIRSVGRAKKNSEKPAVVIGMSATPVVNNLTEASNLYEMVTGYKARFGTDPTMQNANAAHARMSRIGLRWVRNYPVPVERIYDEPIDLTPVSAQVAEAIQAGRRKGGLSASVVEKALLPHKLDRISSLVRGKDRPVIVYTQMVEGISGQIAERVRSDLAAAGDDRTVEVYTGDVPLKKREEILDRFRTGKTHVLVASGPIATGVDGLQRACSEAVVVSPAWTAAQDEQLVGRLHRTGQMNPVKITYVQSQIEMPDGQVWSWDGGRLRLVEEKRGLARHVTDGQRAQVVTGDESEMSSRLVGGIPEGIAGKG